AILDSHFSYQVIKIDKINYSLIISQLMLIIIMCTDALMQRPFPTPPTLPYGRPYATSLPHPIKYSNIFEKWYYIV
ncbi:hypothetical protein, partial [Hydrocoleum sp. CS-953]|uniref:hypothetical protein n=1 Tax=Hydrocoleum sp. CS-953 TaxID=1671698 RepID=UPI001AF006FE